MVTSTSGVTPSNPATDFTFTATSTAGSTDTFGQQLLSAIEGYLGNSGSNSLEIDIQGTPQSQNSDTRQFVVTVKNTAATAAASNPTPMSTTPPATLATTTTPSTTSSTAADDPTLGDKSQMSPDDAYWAMQPLAVQALRNMPDAERGQAAQELANEGYTIDVPIMVWGWDPLATMVQRQIDGYTWVPSANQASIPAGPGIDFPGRPSYDPNNPPPGSIKVSTDFALGTNGQNPAMKYVTGSIAS